METCLLCRHDKGWWWGMRNSSVEPRVPLGPSRYQRLICSRVLVASCSHLCSFIHRLSRERSFIFILPPSPKQGKHLPIYSCSLWVFFQAGSSSEMKNNDLVNKLSYFHFLAVVFYRTICRATERNEGYNRKKATVIFSDLKFSFFHQQSTTWSSFAMASFLLVHEEVHSAQSPLRDHLSRSSETMLLFFWESSEATHLYLSKSDRLWGK